MDKVCYSKVHVVLEPSRWPFCTYLCYSKCMQVATKAPLFAWLRFWLHLFPITFTWGYGGVRETNSQWGVGHSPWRRCAGCSKSLDAWDWRYQSCIGEEVIECHAQAVFYRIFSGPHHALRLPLLHSPLGEFEVADPFVFPMVGNVAKAVLYNVLGPLEVCKQWESGHDDRSRSFYNQR